MYQMTFEQLDFGQKFTCSEMLCELEKLNGCEAISAYGTTHQFANDMPVYSERQC